MLLNTKVLIRGIILIALAIAPVIAIVFMDDFNAILTAISQFNANSIVLLTSLSLLLYIIRYIRWDIICRENNIYIAHKKNIIIYFAGLVMAFTPARGGEIMRTYFIPNTESRLRFALHSFFVERISDLIAVAIYCAIAIYYIQPKILQMFKLDRMPSAFEVLLIVFTVLIVCVLIIIYNPLDFKRKLKGLKSITLGLTPVYAAKSIAISLIIWGLQLYIVLLIAELSLLSTTTTENTFIYTASLVVGTVSMMPGGLGGFDVAYMMLMSLFEQSPENALFSLIAIRIFGLWFGVILGMPAWLISSRTMIKSMKAS